MLLSVISTPKLTLPPICLPRDSHVGTHTRAKQAQNHTLALPPTPHQGALRLATAPFSEGPRTSVSTGATALSGERSPICCLQQTWPQHQVRDPPIPSQQNNDRFWWVQLQQQRAYSVYRKPDCCRFPKGPACKHSGLLTWLS